MKCSVIILNWNGASMLRQYLPSVVAHTTLPDCEVVVADNGSTDNSLEVLSQEFHTVRVIALDKNYGFAEGYNRAIDERLKAGDVPEYVVLLNSDVEVTEGWLNPLTAYLDAHPDVAAVQPKIRSWRNRNMFEHAGAAGGFLNPLGYPYCRGRILWKVEEDKGQYDTIVDVDWTSGACMCVRYIRSAEVWMRRSLPTWRRLTCAGECATKAGDWFVCPRVSFITWEAARSTTRVRERLISTIETTF